VLFKKNLRLVIGLYVNYVILITIDSLRINWSSSYIGWWTWFCTTKCRRSVVQWRLL